MINYDLIFENNRKWVERMKGSNANFFAELASSQSPDYLYIGCSDSRVPANEIMGLAPGDVFVHRNIANVVPSTDLNVMSVVEYAVKYLRVKHIIVCGHYNCGGVKAAMEPKDYGILNPWLRNIRDVYRMHNDELNAIEDTHKRFDRLVELNVIDQATNVIKLACVQQRWLEEDMPTVHGWVFDLRDGLLKDLNVDFDGIMRDIQNVYNLTDQPWVKSKIED